MFTDCTHQSIFTNVTYTVHVNGSMSARLETNEGEKVLTCVNNE